jgi:Pectate lyase superfamily protein
MQRRALFSIGGMALASAGFLSPAGAAVADAAPTGLGLVNVKDPRFGAVGDYSADDTKAIQAAANYCFGSPEAPHGSVKVTSNSVLYFPPGNYRIKAPIKVEKLHGARVLGSGRFVTKIVNETSGPVFMTNGCGYCHFEGLYLRSSDRGAAVFALDWDGTPGGAALQSNAFIDIMFDGGGYGIDIGAGGYMGSENIFVNCFWIYSAIAGLKTSNFNALQNTIVGGNFQSCNMGVWVSRGSVCVIEGTGFQVQKEWDIRVDNSANDTINIIGCRSESQNFVQVKNFVHTYIVGCTQTAPTTTGYFLHPAGCPTTVERCVSVNGQIKLGGDARLSIRGCSFGRDDWLSYGPLDGDRTIELEDVQYGGTPNIHSLLSPPKRIAKQRITAAGVHDYALSSA